MSYNKEIIQISFCIHDFFCERTGKKKKEGTDSFHSLHFCFESFMSNAIFCSGVNVSITVLKGGKAGEDRGNPAYFFACFFSHQLEM